MSVTKLQELRIEIMSLLQKAPIDIPCIGEKSQYSKALCDVLKIVNKHIDDETRAMYDAISSGVDQIRNGETISAEDAINNIREGRKMSNTKISDEIERLRPNAKPFECSYKDWRKGVDDAVGAIEYMVGCSINEIQIMDNPKEKTWKEGELPPVGVECEVSEVDSSINDQVQVGDKVNIIAHYDNDGAQIAAFTHGEPGVNLIVEGMIAGSFRPLRTEREKAVEEMAADMFTLDAENGSTAAAEYYERMADKMYRAGYRKQEDV